MNMNGKRVQMFGYFRIIDGGGGFRVAMDHDKGALLVKFTAAPPEPDGLCEEPEDIDGSDAGWFALYKSRRRYDKQAGDWIGPRYRPSVACTVQTVPYDAEERRRYEALEAQRDETRKASKEERRRIE